MTNPFTSKAHERWAIVGTIDPDVTTASTVLSDAIDMSKYTEIWALVLAGTLGASATVDAKLTQATTSGGTYKDVTGKAITQLVKATDDDKQATIQCRGEDLDMDNSYRYVKLSLTVGTATSDVGAVVIGRVKEGLASSNDLASVAETV